MCMFVEQEYAYFDIKKTDWKRACGAYAPQAAATPDMDGFVGLLERALGELYDHHAHLGTNTSSSARLVPTGAQIVATWRDGKAFVSDVLAGSPAEAAGLQTGVQILAIDDALVNDVVDQITPKYLSGEDRAAREWALQVALAGNHNHKDVRLLIKKENAIQEVRFAFAIAGRTALLTHRRVGTVGYIRIHNSLGEQALVKEFDDALSQLSGMRSVVIDLRDTPSGGVSSVARGILGRFVQRLQPYQRHELVSEQRATGIRRVWMEYVSPRGIRFQKPVVVLVGKWTGSMGEGLAIGLNATLGASVVGRPMAHLLGALGETVLPYSKITVRIPTEKISHVNGLPRESFVPIPVPGANTSSTDQGLGFAVDLARKAAPAKALLKTQ